MALSAYDIVVGEPLNRAVPWDIWLHRMIRRKGWGTKSYIIAYLNANHFTSSCQAASIIMRIQETTTRLGRGINH